MYSTEQTGVAEKVYELCTRDKVVISAEKSVLQVSFFRGFRRITKRDYYLCNACPSSWNNAAPTGRIWYLSIFRKSIKKIAVSLKS